MSRRIPTYIPLDEKYLSAFNTTTVARWIADHDVRENLVQAMFTINDIALEDIATFDDPIFQSPYIDEYKAYVRNTILPNYLEYLRHTHPQRTNMLEKTLNILLTIAYGEFTLASGSVGFILSDVFKYISMTKMPAAGNCYFCSVGANAGIPADELRTYIASAIVKDGEYIRLAEQYIAGCRGGKFAEQYNEDPDSFIEEFPFLLELSCEVGDTDCNECIWGGNEYDSYVANALGAPLVAISIDRAGREVSIPLVEIVDEADMSIIYEYTQSRSIRYREDQAFTIDITYIFPVQTYVDDPDLEYAFDIPTTPAGYVYRHSHFDAIALR
jgi:hypothetical protein